MMDTNDLIRSLAADGRPSASLKRIWWTALAVAVALAAAMFFAMLAPRPDMDAAMHTPRFLFKFVITLALVASALPALLALARPGRPVRKGLAGLAAAPLLLVAGAAFEMAAIPQPEWSARMIGNNSRVCLALIPLIGIGPLAAILLALRQSAPTNLVLTGVLAGVLAGGLSATFYAMHCPDDSPLFVALWYSTAITILAGLGALLGPRILRW